MSICAAAIGDLLGRAAAGGARETLVQALTLFLPLVGIGFLLHAEARFLQGRLAARFGWGSVLVTGWIGTPVHELSHALACLVFGHRIREIALFRPDPESGVLGYVRHTWNPRNPYASAGNFFIGLAPLAGGGAVLFLLLWVFFPGTAREALSGFGAEPAGTDAGFLSVLRIPAATSLRVLGDLLRLEILGSWPFWLFLYLVLCIGSHLGPSPSDFRSARPGLAVLLLVLFLFLANAALIILGVGPQVPTLWLARLIGPPLSLLAVGAVLFAAAGVPALALTKLPGGPGGRP